jgi:exonuclease SbcC
MRHGVHRMDLIQAEIGRIDLLLAERHELEVALAELDERLQLEDQAQRALQATVEALHARLTAAELTESALQRAATRLERLTVDQAELQRRKDSAAAEIATLEAITSREEEIRRNVEALRRWRTLADQLSVSLSERQPIERRIAELEASIQRASAELEQKLALQRQTAATARERLADLDQKQALLDNCEREIEAGQMETRDRAKLQERLERDQDRLNELTAGNAALRSRMEEIRLKIEALSAGDATCPICRRPIAAGEHRHIHDAWTTEGTELGDAYRETLSTITSLKADIGSQRHVLECLETVSRNVVRAETEAKQYRSLLASRPPIEQSMRATCAEIERLEQTLASSGFCPAERSELKRLQEELNDNLFDPEEHAEARRHVQRLEPAEQELNKLELARSEVAGLRKRIADLEQQLQVLATDSADTRKEVADLTSALEGIDGVRREHADAAQSLAEMAVRRRTLEQRRGGLARRLEELGERSKEKLELECEAMTLGARIDAYRELATAFGRDGIQAMVIENVLPELEDETNRLLSRMTTKQLEVQFLTTREAVSTKHDIETLDIIIRDEAGRRPYQLFSGGEAFRINFAIRVALSKLLARRAGATVDTLIIDEGFGTQDQEGRDGLVEALQSVSRDFQLILVITHITELRDQFPNRIEIVKTDAGSRATLI